jgi:hypothetical protein
LGSCYFGRANRLEAYLEITERILAPEISTNLGFGDADKKTLAKSGVRIGSRLRPSSSEESRSE